MRLSDLPLLLTAAILLVSGAVRNDDQWSGELLIAGFIAFGAWLALEVDRVLSIRRTKGRDGQQGEEQGHAGRD